jgi:rhodanese-related sulfurtransferase
MHEAIAGAIRIPPEELAQRLDELPKSRTVITYCT